jgi:hypothetical protein
MLACNLISLCRQGVLRSDAVSGKPGVQHTLKTFRNKLFAKAGYISHHSRKRVISLAVAMQQREWFDGLWDKSKTFTLPDKFMPVFFP